MIKHSKSNSPTRFSVRPLVAMLTLASFAPMSVQAATFSTIPVYAQSNSSSGLPAAKHNVMIILNNSYFTHQTDSTGKERFQTMKDNILTVLNTKMTVENVGEKKIADLFNWGVIGTSGTDMNAPTRQYWEANYKNESFGDPNIIQTVTNMQRVSSGGPDIVSRFLDSMAILQHSFKYRCQKGHILLVTSGDDAVAANSRRLYYDTAWGYRADSPRYETSSTGYPWFFNRDRINMFFSPKEPWIYTQDIEGKDPSKRTLVTTLLNLDKTFRTSYSMGNTYAYAQFIADGAYNTDFRDGGNGSYRWLDGSGARYSTTDAAGKNWDDTDGGKFDAKQNIASYAFIHQLYDNSIYWSYFAKLSSGNNYQPLSSDDSATFVENFKNIIKKIMPKGSTTATSSTGAIAPVITQYGQGGAGFYVTTDLATGSSTLTLNTPNNYGSSSTSGTQMNYNNRRVIARIEGNNYWLRDASGNTDYTGNNSAFGLTGGSNADEWKDALIPWITRSKADATIAALSGNSLTYRNRDTDAKRNMGDIVGSPIVSSDHYLITAANDGLVYIFDTNTNSLKLNYMPASMPSDNGKLMERLKNIAANDYATSSTNPHQWLINGGISVRKTNDGKHFMAGNMGQGGRGTYALNLKALDGSESSWKDNVPLFEATGNGNMGYTIGAPQIARYNNTQAVFVGNGINGTTAETALYIYDAANGTQLQKITVAGSTSGLMQPILVDANFDGSADVAYAADLDGGLYRFDFSTNSAKKIFQAKSGQRVTSSPEVLRIDDAHKDKTTARYVVIFGTGSEIFEGDSSDITEQTVYGIYDEPNKNESEVQLSELLQQTLTSSKGATESGILYTGTKKGSDGTTVADTSSATRRGWYLNLSTGERVVVKPEISLRTVFITTRSYTSSSTVSGAAGSDACYSGSTSIDKSGRLLQLKADTGGQLQPEYPDDKSKVKYYPFITNDNDDTPVDSNGNREFPNLPISLTGVISYTTYVGNQNSTGIGSVSSSTTLNGSFTGNGEEPNTFAAPNKFDCFDTDQNQKLHVLSNTGAASIKVKVKTCSTSKLRRLSWREIF